MRKLWIAAIAAGIALVAMSALQYLTRPDEGDLAPGFKLRSLDSEVVSLDGFRGRPVILHFWASWCGACRQEFPSLARLQSDFEEEGLAVLAISLDESREEAAAFAASVIKSGMVVLMDTDGTVADSYQSYAVPETFLIDRDGRIVWRRAGSVDWDSAEARARVKELS